MAQPLIPRKPRTQKAKAPPAPKALPAKRVIDKPGVYRDVPAEIYHGQLTPTPSISAGMAIEMEKTCPALAFERSYLNPAYEPPTAKHFDIGSAAHLIVLEPEDFAKRTHEIRAKDYRKEFAQIQKDHARAQGKVPLLTREIELVRNVRDRIMTHPLTKNSFVGGTAEQTVVARDPKTGLWLKVRPDFAPPDWSDAVDLKILDSIHPGSVARKIDDFAWPMRAAFYMDTIHAATGVMPKRYWFVLCESSPPHLVDLIHLDEDALIWGRKQNRRAIDLWNKCLTDDSWPSYAELNPRLRTLPPWAQYRLADRDGAHDFEVKPSQAQLAAAMRFQQPL